MRLSTLTRDVTTDGTRMRWIGYVATILWWSGVVRSLTSLNRGHSYKISPKPCRVSGSTNFGTCMFVWECIKSEGTHAGVCVDSFMFGSCCIRNETSLPITTTSFETSTIATSTTNSVKPQQQISYNGVTSLVFGNAERPSSSSSSSQLVGGSGRPLHKRPQAKPSSEFQDYGTAMHQYSNNGWSKLPQNVGARPVKRPTTDAFDRDEFHGFKDKIDDDPSTSATRIPGKNQGSNGPETLRTRPPVSASWNVDDHADTQLDGQDSVAHETVYRPSYLHNQPEEKITSTYRPVSVIDHDHDARPNFVSRPETWKKPTKSRTTPKPVTYQSIHEDAHLSTSGALAQTTHWRVTTEPAFVTKLSTTMTPGLPFIHTTTIPSIFPTASSTGTTGTSGNKGDSGYWSEQHSWTPPVDTMMKPHWNNVHGNNNNNNNNNNEPERHQNRPHFESTESQQTAEYDKPSIGAAHYITTDDFGTALTRPRPTKRRKPPLSGTKVGTSALVTDRRKNQPTTEMTPSTTVSMVTSVATKPPVRTTIKTSNQSSTSSTTTTTAIPIESTTTATAAATMASTTMTKTKTKTTTTTTTTTLSSSSTMKTTTMASSTTPHKIGSVPIVSAVGQGDKTECGVPALFPRPETRIVGGKDAPFGRWPWQVSVRRTSFFGFSSTHRCGGAVLNANWIATAGHCVDDLLTSQIRIRVGDYDFSSVQERLPYVERGIAKKVVHPKYNFFTYEYDLALVRLESALVFAPHISPICLPATEDLLIGENATVTGWGRLSEGGTLPSVLQEVSVPIVSNDRCKSMFLRAGRHEFIPEIFLCAGYESGGHDSCQGDSGGPLQVRGKDGRYFLAGIISWGIGCAEANLPGVCTRISKFTSWILKNVT